MKKSTRGFTIVELLVVIIVIVILASIGSVTYARLQTQSRDNKRKADISVLQSQLETYYQKNNEYPGSCSSSCTMYSSGVQIIPGQTLATLQTALPGLPNDFGDPLLSSGSSIFNTSINFPGYFYMGGMLNTTGGGYGEASQKTFSWPGGSLTCNYSISLSAGQQGSYIIGYYDEADQKPVFLRGQHGVQYQWPYSPSAQPACITS